MCKAQPLRFKFWLSTCGFAAVMAIPLCSHAQQVFRCLEGGQTVFKDSPCPGALGTVGEDVKRRDTERASQRATQRAAEEKREQEAKEARLWQLERKNECGPNFGAAPVIGMEGAWVERCSSWREPHKKNLTTTGRGTRGQWVYEGRGYLYVNESDVVYSIQVSR